MKAGQLCTIHNIVYRAQKRKCGCRGCAFEYNIYLCPAVKDSRYRRDGKINCVTDNIILNRI